MKINAIKANGVEYDIWATEADVTALNNQGNAALGTELESGKQLIAQAINAKGGTASADESLSQLADDIESIPLQVAELNADMELSDLMAFINTKYNTIYKGYIAYMWEAVDDTYTCILPTADLIVLSDGQTTTGGEVTIQLNPTQRFFFALLLYREGNTSASLAPIGTARELNRVIVGGDMIISTIGGFNAYNSTTLELGKNIVVGDLLDYAFQSNKQLNRLYIDLQAISGDNAFADSNLTSVEIPNLQVISGVSAFYKCTDLKRVEMPNLQVLSNNNTFYLCSALQEVNMPNLTTISGSAVFANMTSCQNINMPNLTTLTGAQVFYNDTALRNIVFGTLISFAEPISTTKPNLRNITIGQDTNINLPFQYWTATNVIAEGQSGIDELNANLQTNLISKLYQGGGKILRLGVALYDVTTQETRDMVTAKGWTLQRG